MEAKLEYMKWYRNKFLSEEEMLYLRSIREDEALIEELFGTDIEFDEEGMKGVMGLGTCKVNEYQIARATQAFSNDIIRKSGGRVGRGIAVGFDNRAMSEKYSDTVVRTLLGNGIGTSLFVVPKSAAQLSFAIRYLNLEGGIMITAEQESKEFNGIKIYNNKGALMSSEDIKSIIKEFKNIQNFTQVHPYVGYLRLNSIHLKIGPANDFKFINKVKETAVNEELDKDIVIAYSPLHGIGSKFVPELLNDIGFKKVYTVKEQMITDGEFATVNYPNPMDKAAIEMTLNLAKEKSADLALVTDPNCTAVVVAVKESDSDYRVLDSNQAGALLIDYIVRFKKDMPEKPLMLQTESAGKLAAKIADKAGVRVIETADGFKNIGEALKEYEENEDTGFVFAQDEKGGYLAGLHSLERDGIGACMLFAEMAGFYKLNGYSLLDRLTELCEEYGC